MSELKIETLKEGDGVSFPQKGQKCTMHYVLKLQDGKVVDSSRAKGRPFTFTLGAGQVIQGWDQGVAQLSKGQLVNLLCPPNLAYGPNGIPGAIPPNATLCFEVELLSFE